MPEPENRWMSPEAARESRKTGKDEDEDEDRCDKQEAGTTDGRAAPGRTDPP